MESAVSGGRPGQEHPRRQGCSRRNYKGSYSQASPSFEERGEDPRSYERQRKNGIVEAREDWKSTGAITRQSQETKGSAHKRGRSPDGCLDDRSRENGRCREKGRGGPSPAQRGRDHRSDCPAEGPRGHGTRGAAHSPWRHKDRRTRRRSPVRTTHRGRCQDGREARPASPKRRRCHLWPEAREPLEVVTGRLFDRVGALAVGLDELRAPGGAFLPVPTRRTQPSASQRAWLSWQLAHAGATLHWAASLLHALLAQQPGPAGQPPAALGARGARP